MTIDKSKEIRIPIWLLAIIISVVSGIISAFASKATMEEKVYQVEQKTEKLDREKVSRNEFEMIQAQLNRIEDKVDMQQIKKSN